MLEYIEGPSPVATAATLPTLGDGGVCSSETWRELTVEMPSMMSESSLSFRFGFFLKLGVGLIYLPSSLLLSHLRHPLARTDIATQDDYISLLQSLGVPIDDLISASSSTLSPSNGADGGGGGGMNEGLGFGSYSNMFTVGAGNGTGAGGGMGAGGSDFWGFGL